MLEIKTKTKWPPSLRKSVVTLELSNGEKYLLESKFIRKITLRRYITFQLSSDKEIIDFRVVSKRTLKIIYGAFQGQKEILRIHSGLRDRIEIDKGLYKLEGFFKNRIKIFDFYCTTKPFLIGHELNACFPETFKTAGLILVSYIYLKRLLKEG